MKSNLFKIVVGICALIRCKRDVHNLEKSVRKIIWLIFVLAVSVSAVSGESTLNPQYPVVAGTIKMTGDWSISLPDSFNRRFEEGSMVLWKQGFTIWINIWENDKKRNPYDQLEFVRAEKSKDAFDIVEIKDSGVYRYGYRIDENRISDKKPVYAFYGYVAGKSGYAQAAFYFDGKSGFDSATAIWMSIKEI